MFSKVSSSLCLCNLYVPGKEAKKWNKSAKQHGLCLATGGFLSPKKEHTQSPSVCGESWLHRHTH